MKETVIPKIREEKRRVKIVFELKKDLQEDEVICEHCHGTGLEIANNVYGISGDTTHIGVHFPYKHQSISFCRFCYNGVMKKCPSCGSLRGKQDRECPCGHAMKEREEKWKKENNERWEKAEKVPIEKIWETCKCLYVDDIDQYIFDEGELDDRIEEYELENPRIYGTIETQIKINASSIIEDACNDLHENAYDQCDAESLQNILDEWCKKQSGATSYYPNYKIGVIRAERKEENNHA